MAVNILEHIWILFIAIGGWVSSRLVQKIDALEKGKADASITREEHLDDVKLIHELDRRVDENQHMSVGRGEHKSDITALHLRVNDLERRKADKIKNIRTHSSKDKNGES